jgi:tetratricopeptide (TPR) repeat protein
MKTFVTILLLLVISTVNAQTPNYKVLYHPVTIDAACLPEKPNQEVVINGQKLICKIDNTYSIDFYGEDGNRKYAFRKKYTNDKGIFSLEDYFAEKVVFTIKYAGKESYKFRKDGRFFAILTQGKKSNNLQVFEYNGKWKEIIKADFDLSVGEPMPLYFQPYSNMLYFSFEHYSGKVDLTPKGVPEQISLPFEKVIFRGVTPNGKYYNIAANPKESGSTTTYETFTIEAATNAVAKSIDGEKFSVPYYSNFLIDGNLQSKEAAFSEISDAWVVFGNCGKYYFEGETIPNHFGIILEGESEIKRLDKSSPMFGPVDWAANTTKDVRERRIAELSLVYNYKNNNFQKAFAKIMSWEPYCSLQEKVQFMSSNMPQYAWLYADSVCSFILKSTAPEIDALGLETCTAIYGALVKYNERNKNYKLADYYKLPQNVIDNALKIMTPRTKSEFFTTYTDLIKGNIALEYDKICGTKHAVEYYNAALATNENMALYSAKVGEAYLVYKMYDEALIWFNKSQLFLANYPLPMWGKCMVATEKFKNSDTERNAEKAHQIILLADAFLNANVLETFENEKVDITKSKFMAMLYIEKKAAFSMFLMADILPPYDRSKALADVYQTIKNSPNKQLAVYILKSIVYPLLPLTTQVIKDFKDPNSEPYHAIAIEHLKKIVETGLADEHDYWQLVQHLRDVEKHDEALAILNQGLLKYKTSKALLEQKQEADFKFAKDLIFDAKYDQAYPAITKIFKEQIEPSNDLYLYMAIVHYYKKEYDLAYTYFNKRKSAEESLILMDMFPNYYELGKYTARREGIAPEIQNRCNEISKIERQHNSILAILETNPKLALQQIDSMITSLKNLDAKMCLGFALNTKGVICEKLDYYPSDFRDYFLQSIDKNPYFIKPYQNLIRITQGRTDSFLEEYLNLAHRNFPDNDQFKNRLFHYYYDNAIEEYNEGVEKKSSFRFKDAIDYCTKALALDNNPEAMLLLGLSYEGSENHPKAKEWVRKAIDADPSLKNGTSASAIKRILDN